MPVERPSEAKECNKNSRFFVLDRKTDLVRFFLSKGCYQKEAPAAGLIYYTIDYLYHHYVFVMTQKDLYAPIFKG